MATGDVHPDARCFRTLLADSAVGAFSSVGRGVAVGERTRIGAHVTIGERASLGSDIEVADGARIGSESTIEDRAVVGLGAIIGSQIRLGLNCVVRPGSVVNDDVPPNATVEGNPAKIVGYVATRRRGGEVVDAGALLATSTSKEIELDVGSASLWNLPRFEDLRGALVPADFGTDLPFVRAC